jgi:hypothetical protein
MGCACLRGDGHHWPDRGAGCVAAGRWQQGGVAHQPDAAGADACPQLLRHPNDPVAISLRKRDSEPDADSHSHSYPNAISYRHTLGKPIGYRDRRRFPDAMSIAGRHRDAITVAERQRETVGLALGPA